MESLRLAVRLGFDAAIAGDPAFDTAVAVDAAIAIDFKVDCMTAVPPAVCCSRSRPRGELASMALGHDAIAFRAAGPLRSSNHPDTLSW
jgi:hypothetical protein